MKPVHRIDWRGTHPPRRRAQPSARERSGAVRRHGEADDEAEAEVGTHERIVAGPPWDGAGGGNGVEGRRRRDARRLWRRGIADIAQGRGDGSRRTHRSGAHDAHVAAARANDAPSPGLDASGDRGRDGQVGALVHTGVTARLRSGKQSLAWIGYGCARESLILNSRFRAAAHRKPSADGSSGAGARSTRHDVSPSQWLGGMSRGG